MAVVLVLATPEQERLARNAIAEAHYFAGDRDGFFAYVNTKTRRHFGTARAFPPYIQKPHDASRLLTWLTQAPDHTPDWVLHSLLLRFGDIGGYRIHDLQGAGFSVEQLAAFEARTASHPALLRRYTAERERTDFALAEISRRLEAQQGR